jgi:hypothetical protein
MDAFGFACIEMWGGATFDACIRYLKEDPWERVRIIKQYVKKTLSGCSSEAKTCLATPLIPMMWLTGSFPPPPGRASTSSSSSTA